MYSRASLVKDGFKIKPADFNMKSAGVGVYTQGANTYGIASDSAKLIKFFESTKSTPKQIAKIQTAHIGELSTKQEKIDALMKLCGYSAEEAERVYYSIDDFTSGLYNRVHQYQRNGKFAGTPIESVSKDIEDFIARSPQWQGDTYRGMALGEKEVEDIIAKLKSGNYSFGTTSSWTTERDSVRGFIHEGLDSFNKEFNERRTESVTFIAKGHSKATSVMHLSDKPDEKEVLGSLLNRYSLKSVSRDGNKWVIEIEPANVASKLTPKQIADARHAARTPEYIASLQTKWRQRVMRNLSNEAVDYGCYDELYNLHLSKMREAIRTGDLEKYLSSYNASKKYISDLVERETKAVKTFLSNPANKTNMQEVAKALGIEPGDCMTFWEADQLKGNPHYSTDKIYRINCQTCVVANELRRRGFDVSALGNTKGSMLEKLSWDTNHIWRDTHGNIPEKIRVGATFSPTRVDPDGMKWGIYTKTLKNRKQMISALEKEMSVDGRYHVDWCWESGSGHIITAERINGVVKYYDPQNGKVINDLYKYIEGIEQKRGICLLRVDDKRIDASWAKEILAPGKSGAKSGTAATGGITGRVTPEVINLRKQALASDDFTTHGDRLHHDNLLTSQIYLGKKPLERLINHCISQEEIDAAKYLWTHPEALVKKRISPLGEVKDMTSDKAIRNIEKKQKRGVVEYVEYEMKFNP